MKWCDLHVFIELFAFILPGIIGIKYPYLAILVLLIYFIMHFWYKSNFKYKIAKEECKKMD